LSFWGNVLLLSGGQGLLLSLALLSSVFLKKWSNFFLGLATLVISLEILSAWSLQVGYNTQPRPFPFWLLGSYLILPPAIFMFSQLNTRPGFRLRAGHGLLFLPALLEIVVEFFAFYSNTYLGTTYRPFDQPLWFVFTEILPVVATLVVLTFWAIALRQLQVQARHFPGVKPYLHVRKVLAFFILFSLMTLLWLLEAIFQLAIFRITVTVLCAFLYTLGYIAFFRPDFFHRPAYFTRPPATGFGESQEEERAEVQRIHSFFQEQHLYRQSQLTLKKAANQLDVPPRRVSELINTYHGVDFRRYVNTFRVEEVIRRVEQGEAAEKTLLGIALESGFGSKSSFNKIFKEITGKTPTHFFKK